MRKLISKKLAVILIFIFSIVGFGLAVYAKQSGNLPIANNEDPKLKQIARLADLDNDTVMKLYKAVGDWDKLFRNISIYKQLLSQVEGIEAEKQLFNIIPKYEATDLYVAYDYFLTHEFAIEEIEEALELRTKGEDWQVILPQFTESKKYKNYQVLAKEELRRLLGQGYLPEDILQADKIARAKDLPLESVLKLKNDSNNWQSIALLLHYKGKEYKRNFKLTVPGVTVTTDDDLEGIIMASNKKAEQRKKDEERKVETELGLTDKEFQKYVSEGHNQYEVRNAFKLAKANNVTPEEVLNKKKEGKSWEEILADYPEH